ncbi:MAG: rod shape-determining protein MreD [Bacteroidaceae bacterium]|nr:rod shape-determining protein MreD [Bacteroidaceae bacterium]
MEKFFKRLTACLLLLFVQILLLNRLIIMGHIVPFAYFMLVLILDSDVSSSKRMIWGFAMGLVVDVFMNTPGLQASVMTLLAYIQRYLLRLFVSFDRRDRLEPGVVSMGMRYYSFYLILGSFVFNSGYYLLVTSLNDGWKYLLVEVLLGTAISVLMMLVFEYLFRRNIRRRLR